ncbi:MAG: metallophosphoesterase [Candidatus Njordarchaeales archaeon]
MIRPEGTIFNHLFISDLHIGSLWFDVMMWRYVLGWIEKYRFKALDLHILGDVVEGKLNHRGQYYESFPLEIQESMAINVLSELIDLVDPRRIHILPGNHDRKYGINLLDNVVNVLREKHRDKIFHYYRDSDYYVVDNTLCLHGLKGFRGSDYLGLTPQILNNVVEFARLSGGKIEKIIMGHYHRYANIHYMGYDIYLLPSFQYSERPLRMERGILFLDNSGVIYKIIVKGASRNALIKYWKEIVKV